MSWPSGYQPLPPASPVERASLIEGLRDEQSRRCAYGSRDGDGRTCDCKYASPLRPWASEATGCPELRAAIAVLLGQIVDLPKGDGRG